MGRSKNIMICFLILFVVISLLIFQISKLKKQNNYVLYDIGDRALYYLDGAIQDMKLIIDNQQVQENENKISSIEGNLHDILSKVRESNKLLKLMKNLSNSFDFNLDELELYFTNLTFYGSVLEEDLNTIGRIVMVGSEIRRNPYPYWVVTGRIYDEKIDIIYPSQQLIGIINELEALSRQANENNRE